MDFRTYGQTCLLLCWLTVMAPSLACAGGSSLNVVVIANEVSPDSLELANYYVEQRQVPPENLLRISWSGGNVQWTRTEFVALLLNPLLSFLAEDAQRSNQIHVVVLCMDIPYRVVDGPDANSITSALFYGFKSGTTGLQNSYKGSEERYASARPDTAPMPSFLAVMLTAGSLEEAKLLVDQGVSSDGSRAAQTALLAKTSDPLRNRRFLRFDNAIFNTRLRPPYCLERIVADDVNGTTNILGYQTGLANFSVAPEAFVSGAIADSLTSSGGKLFESHGQTTLLEFIHAGAAGSYGTVTEPGASLTKFPDPQVYFYQARGFSLAECYYQGIGQPYQGLMVGEPLAAPYAITSSGGWVSHGTGSALQGVTNLWLRFEAGAGGTPVDRVDLYVDGVYDRTLTNLMPCAGNQLEVRLDGYAIRYDVPTNATITSVASGIADLLNQPEHADVTHVQAEAFGDRIELQATQMPLPPGTLQFVDQPEDPSTPRAYQAMRVEPWGRARGTDPGLSGSGRFQFTVDAPTDAPYIVEASSNLVVWTPVLTNATGGPMDFVEAEGESYPLRFYRAAPPLGRAVPAWIIPLGLTPNGAFRARVMGTEGAGQIVQASPDGSTWDDIYTHADGGSFEFIDAGPTNAACRLYRTRSLDTNSYADVSIVGNTSSSGNIVRVEHGLAGPYLVYASTNSTEWFTVYEVTSPSGIRVDVNSAAGTSDLRTTFLAAASPEFLDSAAHGYSGFVVELDPFALPPPTLGPDSYLELTVTQTNGQMITVTATNPPANTTDVMVLAQELAQAVNLDPELTEVEGVVVEDVAEGFFDTVEFNVRARAPGWKAAGIRVHLTGSSDMAIWLFGYGSHTGPVSLETNLPDLRPRNHLYVAAGQTPLPFSFDVDTTSLSDGHHELTAVAYGGNSVHAQSLDVLPVVVDNTPLQADITSPSAGTSDSVTSTVEVTVQVNTSKVQEIMLYGTGGLLDREDNGQDFAVFNVDGSGLGAGKHPFYAIVTAHGSVYRTETIYVTLTRD